MIEFSNRGRLIEEADELPAVPTHVGRLYLDFETSSRHPDIKSLNPWDVDHCRVIGAAITWDDDPDSYFVPRHLLLTGFLYDLMAASDSWVNHNVKYDYHVAENDLGLEYCGDLVDTISLCKILDADRTYKGGYALDVLSEQLLGESVRHYEYAMQPYLAKTGKNKNKDYARIPIDLLAEYACQDVITCRKLERYILAELPEEASWVVENEMALASSLVAMESRGLQIDPTQVKVQKVLDMQRMVRAEESLKAMVGYDVTPTSYDDCYDLLINRYNFPVIYNDKQLKSESPNASFDQDVLTQYVNMGSHWAKYASAVQLILDYRAASQRVSLFWESWLQKCTWDGILHSDYNANVRSGRMSCKTPNAQQLSKIAKMQVLARPGRKLLCWDYSQLEYRWMIHCLQNPAGLKAFNDDPWVDYHQWVASGLCEGLVKRRPAKTLNFTIGFGGGKKRVIAMLSLEPDIIAMFDGDPIKIREFATSVYFKYHRNLPELRQHSQMAENAALRCGYVRTLYGRRLHLPPAFARKGFNRVVQSTAADNAKEATNAASPAHNATLRELDCHMVAQVHDEFLFDVPDDPEVIRRCREEITGCLEDKPSSRCRVPIKAEIKVPDGALTWAEAKGD